MASWAYSQLGRWDDAVEEGQKELSIAEEFSDNSMISFAAWIISIAYTSKGDLGRAIEYGELAVQKAPTPGDKAWAQGPLAWAWCQAGEPHRGVEVLATLVPMHRAARFVPGVIHATVWLGEGYWLAGEYDKARQTLEELLEMAERCGMRFVLGSAHRFLGEIALKTNPTQAGEPLAAPHFEQSIAILREIKAENELALACAGYGRLRKQQGNIAEAREYLTKALEIFERLGVRIARATEDGSAGEAGLVTAPLARALAGLDPDRPVAIYACGPTPMMRAVATLAAPHGRPCWVSLEPVMGCGMGGCYSCVVRVRQPDGQARYVRSCLSGPVFDSRKVVWEELVH